MVFTFNNSKCFNYNITQLSVKDNVITSCIISSFLPMIIHRFSFFAFSENHRWQGLALTVPAGNGGILKNRDKCGEETLKESQPLCPNYINQGMPAIQWGCWPRSDGRSAESEGLG